MIGIYKITSPSNKINIGQSWDIKQRKHNYSGVNCKNQTKLYNSLKKHGWDNHKFEVIHELPSDVTQEVMDNFEILYINQYRECGFEMMNLREGGSRGKHSEETKYKMKNSPNRSYNISKALKGKKFSKEHIKNMSQPRTCITKQKMSESAIGKPKSENHIQNMKIGKLGKGGKQIICINNNKIFNTLKEASEYYKINPRSISNILLGLAKQTRKHFLTFKYK